MGQRMANQEDRKTLQKALDDLCDWADRWGMEFNIPKCKVMHMGHQNPEHKFSMRGKELETTCEEKDIGVAVTSNLKPSAQCAKAAKTAQTLLGQLSRAFHYRDRHVFARLYKQYVRPHLEFSTAAWSPWTAQDIERLEKVQKRAVNMVSGLKGTTYEEKLEELELLKLEERRHQSDMLMVYKIMHKEHGLDPETWFESATPTNGHATRSTADPFNIKVRTGRLEVRKNFFSMRVIKDWNKIPVNVKSLPSAWRFKREYRRLRADLRTA
jgi:hypothetical protein